MAKKERITIYAYKIRSFETTNIIDNLEIPTGEIGSNLSDNLWIEFRKDEVGVNLKNFYSEVYFDTLKIYLQSINEYVRFDLKSENFGNLITSDKFETFMNSARLKDFSFNIVHFEQGFRVYFYKNVKKK
jgi:hypothetical protein